MSEKQEHMMAVAYAVRQYPSLIVHSDWAAGAKLRPGQAIERRKHDSDKGYPDLTIPYATRIYNGLFIELKADGVQIYKKDGTLRANDHVANQAKMLDRLADQGYCATFALGFDDYKQILDGYMAGKEVRQSRTFSIEDGQVKHEPEDDSPF